jgi:NADH-ubiquinone oxidoreductase chain 6
MTALTLISILISLSTTILTCTNPFSMAITVLLIALITSGLYASLHSSWLAFLLFLIYVGGILVIFSYFLAIIPNQQQFNIYLIRIPILSLCLFLLTALLLTDSWTRYIPALTPLTHAIFITYNISILIRLVLILLFTIVTIIKTCKLEKGPLRSFIISYV